MLDLEYSDCLDLFLTLKKKSEKRLICTANDLEMMFWLQEKKNNNKMTGFIDLGIPFRWVTWVKSGSSHTDGTHLNTCPMLFLPNFRNNLLLVLS